MTGARTECRRRAMVFSLSWLEENPMETPMKTPVRTPVRTRLRRALLSAVVGGGICGICGAGSATPGAQAPLTEIRVSYQPALYWALPFFVATEKTWWAELGLQPVFSIFPAGVPQMAAAAAKSWDVGGTGSVPAVLGHMRFGIKTIGLTNDESAANALMVSKAAAAQMSAHPAAMKGRTILLTSNSTGDYAVQSCLKKYGLSKQDVRIKNMGEGEVISGAASGAPDEEEGGGGDHLGGGLGRSESGRSLGAQHLCGARKGRRGRAMFGQRQRRHGSGRPGGPQR